MLHLRDGHPLYSRASPMAGHAEALLGFLKDTDAREHWQEWNDKPFPKLLGHFEYAGNVDHHASKKGETRFWTTQRETPYPDHYPVPVRVANISEIAGFSTDDLRRAYANPDFAIRRKIRAQEAALEEQILKDLHTLKVNAFRRVHRTEKDGQPITQLLVMVPRVKLEGDPANPQEVPDFDGAVTFLAYLLHKGYVTPKDFPAEGLSKQGDLASAFDRTLLKFAESLHYQNKVRAGLGEPLLPAETHRHDRGTRLI